MADNKTITISVHLGTGDEGELRKQALEAIAASKGHTFDGKPSVGRWLVAQADEWIDAIYKQIQKQKGNQS